MTARRDDSLAGFARSRGGGRGEIGEGGAWVPQLPLLPTTGAACGRPLRLPPILPFGRTETGFYTFVPLSHFCVQNFFILYNIGYFYYFYFTFKNNVDKWDKVPVSLVPQGIDASHFYFEKRDIFTIASKQADMPAFQRPRVPLLFQQVGQIPLFSPF